MGRVVQRAGRIDKSEEWERIEEIVSSDMERIRSEDDGWTIIYRHKIYGTYWSLIYPQGDMHSGGPPQLNRIDHP